MNEIEKQFFEAFGIKSKMGCIAYEELGEAKADLICNDYCPACDYLKEVYPKITAYILLKLICLMGNTDYFLITNEGLPINIEGLKDSVLHSLTIYSKFHKGLKEEVQAIFKEQ